MEEQLHNEPFKEEYWDDALAVLMEEERKEARKKRVPFFIVFAVLAIISAVIVLLPKSETGKRALLMHKPQHFSILRAHGTDVEAAAVLEPVVTSKEEPQSIAIAQSTHSSKTKQLNIENEKSDTPTSTSALAKKKTKANDGDPNAGIVLNNEADKQKSNGDEVTLNDAEESGEINETKNNVAGLTTPANDVNVQPGFMFRSNPELSDFSNATLLALMPKNSNAIDLSLNKSVMEPKKTKDKFRKILRLPVQPQQLMVYAGNAFAPGYGVVKGSQNFNPLAGVAFEQRIANRLWVRIAAGGQQITETNKTRTYLEEQPGFGYEATETRISADRLYLVDVPVNIIWDANPRHSFMAGLGLEGIVQTVNTVTENKITMFGNTEVSKTQSTGYLAGNNPFFYNFNFGYRYRITRRSSIDFNYANGFKGINDNGQNNQRLLVKLNLNIK
jgi:hypothetical protein